MRAFFGGQIKEECRGDLAAVVNREPSPITKLKSGECNVFVYPINSEEFIRLTGVMDTEDNLERVYIGICPEIGKRIARDLNGKQIDNYANLRTIDDMVVMPFFLDKYLDKPKTIVLESIRDGYEVVLNKIS